MVDLTRNQVKKAGRRLRKFYALSWSEMNEIRGTDEMQSVYEAYTVLIAWRRAHAAPLNAAQMGLRSRCRTARCEAEISQRLKRVPTILDKLLREPTLSMERMQDIGGVRAVLPSLDDVRRVQKGYSRRSPQVVRTTDYIATPRDSGYRGVHLVVEYHGRAIEIQLRTRVMHEWAVTVEQVSGRLRENLKQDGSHPVQLLLEAASRAMALEEENLPVDDALLAEMARLRIDAAPYLRGGG